MRERPKGLFFEEFKNGDKFISAERVIKESDVKNFAELSGDNNPIHLEKKFAEASIFGERIAHGLLGLSVVSGLAADLGFVEDTIIALRSIEWKFKIPIRFDDKIRGIFVVSEEKELKGQESGLIVFDVKVMNQSDQVIQAGKWAMIIKKGEEVE